MLGNEESGNEKRNYLETPTLIEKNSQSTNRRHEMYLQEDLVALIKQNLNKLVNFD